MARTGNRGMTLTEGYDIATQFMTSARQQDFFFYQPDWDDRLDMAPTYASVNGYCTRWDMDERPGSVHVPTLLALLHIAYYQVPDMFKHDARFAGDRNTMPERITKDLLQAWPVLGMRFRSIPGLFKAIGKAFRDFETKGQKELRVHRVVSYDTADQEDTVFKLLTSPVFNSQRHAAFINTVLGLIDQKGKR